MIAKQSLLVEHLARLKWTPRELAHAINSWLEVRGRSGERIHPTTPYHWISKGFCPYAPYPQIVAEVLSIALGQVITAHDLWPDKVPPAAGSPRTAAHGLTASWNSDDVVAQIAELAREHPDGTATVSGPDLVTPALDGIHHSPGKTAGMVGADRVRPALMTLITRHIAELRLLDDRAGGGALNLRYVHNELRTVLDLLRNAACEADVHDRLLLVTADLAQLSGWMHWDAGNHGTGQRYLLLAIRAARAAAESSSRELRTIATESTANTLGMLAYQCAHAGHPADAVRLAEAAARLGRAASSATRARLAGRLATAHAAAGDIHAFRDAAEQARRHLDDHHPNDAPPFLYYLNTEQLDAEAGQALVDLAQRRPAEAGKLLSESVDLLTPLTSTGLRTEYQRSALLHGCYLVQAHLHQHDLEAAVAATRKATERLAGVQSVRCQVLVRRLVQAFARRARNPYVADLLPELNDALDTA
ncbi:hypothetical protein GCM10023085_62230 [Actinomadura viridis]|uniref:Transcriptional regulator n=1 Tax=Actinomadura viridis TaxID=58110 RepID=A0A931GG74_9ACTN|nr:hypothetical protein [Actinomadura viridis]MBG6086073.1 hypothetical protein [Actinomadura viridis]